MAYSSKEGKGGGVWRRQETRGGNRRKGNHRKWEKLRQSGELRWARIENRKKTNDPEGPSPRSRSEQTRFRLLPAFTSPIRRIDAASTRTSSAEERLRPRPPQRLLVAGGRRSSVLSRLRRRATLKKDHFGALLERRRVKDGYGIPPPLPHWLSQPFEFSKSTQGANHRPKTLAYLPHLRISPIPTVYSKFMDRPVVVNSLLCFLHNYRDLEDLESLLDKYFTDSIQSSAKTILFELLSESENGYLNGNTVSQPKDLSLLALFDQVKSSEACPVFAASDLTVLPLAMIGNQEGSVFGEIQQIRFLLQNSMASKENSEKILVKKRPHPASTPKQSENGSCPVVSASSPESATPIKLKHESTSIQTTPTPIPTMTNLFNGNGLDMCNLLRLSALQATMLQHHQRQQQQQQHQPESPQLSQSPSPKKRCIDQGNKLDRAVRKLTDRLEAKVEPKDGTNGTHTPETGLNGSRPMSNMSAIEEKPAVNGTATPNSLHTSSSGIFANNHVTPMLNDPMVCVQMLKNLTAGIAANNANLNSMYSFPSVAQDLSMKHDDMKSDDNIIVDGDDGIDDDDKMSNESSPTPSDSSKNSVSGKDDSQSDDKNLLFDTSDKPYMCEQPNCQKKFANKFLLKKHQFIHTGLRPHMCPFCQKRFNRKDNLLRHKKTHLANAMASLEGHRRRNLGFPFESLANFKNEMENDEDAIQFEESA